ncbi:prevent-host-death protein [Candidatus Roizmanbacteria bacterium CG_4_9_14_0_8_um_filter_34_12]|nr:MAG: prevent-host-death protein [Candidatus Roizmanbacteria bacterium CG_4_9_14_0_8_um_filter_34_12]
MNTIAISQFRSNLPKLIDEVDTYMKRLVITVSGKPKAVVLSLNELESLEETAEVLAIPGAKKSILRGLKQAKKRQGAHFKTL